ncbi:MAG: hypothetical protein ACE5K4_12090 [Candidatus Hydrothermarchaeota archaeon]
MFEELTDRQIKASILEFLIKKGRWGNYYFPLETLVNWLSKKIRRDGKRVRKCLRDLVNEGYILIHKRGETISLNPSRSMEIKEFIDSWKTHLNVNDRNHKIVP